LTHNTFFISSASFLPATPFNITVTVAILQVTIDMISVNPDGSEVKVGDTQFIMVARDPVTEKASRVHGLYLPDEEVRSSLHCVLLVSKFPSYSYPILSPTLFYHH
jgi:hypothetical protein